MLMHMYSLIRLLQADILSYCILDKLIIRICTYTSLICSRGKPERSN